MRSTLVALSILAALTSMSAVAQNPEKIVVGLTEKQAFPVVLEPGSEVQKVNGGLYIDWLLRLEEDSGVEVEIRRVPFVRAHKMLEQGSLDGYVTASYKSDREQFAAYPRSADGSVDTSRRHSDSSYHLYTRADSDVDWDGEKFINLEGAVGAQLGFSIVKDLRALGVEIEAVETVEQNAQKLMKGRIDAFTAHADSGDLMVLKYEGVRKIEIPLKSEPYYFLLSRQFAEHNPAVADKLWGITRELRESGFMDERKRYYFSQAAK